MHKFNINTEVQYEDEQYDDLEEVDADEYWYEQMDNDADYIRENCMGDVFDKEYDY